MNASAASPVPGQPKKKPARIALPYWLAEFQLIRLAVVGCAATLAISAAAVVGSNWYLSGANDERTLAQQARDAAYTRYAHVENEKQDIRDFQPQFIALKRKGLIGDERRLDWIDAIRQIQVARNLLPLTYQIEPQQPVKLDRFDQRLNAGDYQLRGSRMSLHMDLLHEADLFDFFTDLKEHGYFGVQDCSIRRQSVASVVNAPTLEADCTLNWLTLSPAAAQAQAAKRRGR
ncbi:hypothetical protein [Rugamonas sp.]|uniref:hypothetical protein n=1 Tax=Rugamonas sp. TaxID=1926287 RepID=UPI0025E3BF5F|nr:hypothetical protein [Rugamonas sp.]